MDQTIRVAAAQFHVGDHIKHNLSSCLRMIEAAGTHKPDLLVLPEFANHCSWYNDAEHCFEVALSLDGEFLAAIAQASRDLSAHVVINCTLRRGENGVTGTSVMFSPRGEILGQSDKHVLIGHENDFLVNADHAGPIIDTKLGRLAMYACMDGVINETPRCLALRGAQVLCNSLNSFARDEGSLHIPVRAAENKVWVVAANKVGPLIPEFLVGPVSQATNIPPHFLDGAGDSQIVAPDGRAVAMAGRAEEVVWADIDVSAADQKQRPGGTDIFTSRRPPLYQPLAEDPGTQAIPAMRGPEELAVAAVSVTAATGDPVDRALSGLAAAQERGARIIVLPELFAVPEGADISRQADRSAALVERLAAACGPDALVACSLPVKVDHGLIHAALLIDRTGEKLRQPQIHTSIRHRWAALGDELKSAETPYGRLAVVVGEDAIYPETVRLLALQGAHTVLIPAAFQESWEHHTGLVERAAENRVNIVAASGRGGCTGLIATLQKDFTIMTPWKEREFDGLLSAPEVARAEDGGPLHGRVHPLAAANKVCSQNTDLLANRPWRLLQPLVE